MVQEMALTFAPAKSVLLPVRGGVDPKAAFFPKESIAEMGQLGLHGDSRPRGPYDGARATDMSLLPRSRLEEIAAGERSSVRRS